MTILTIVIETIFMSRMAYRGALKAGHTNKQLQATDLYVVWILSVVRYENIEMARFKSRC